MKKLLLLLFLISYLSFSQTEKPVAIVKEDGTISYFTINDTKTFSDDQIISYNPTTKILTLESGGFVDLSSLGGEEAESIINKLNSVTGEDRLPYSSIKNTPTIPTVNKTIIDALGINAVQLGGVYAADYATEAYADAVANSSTSTPIAVTASRNAVLNDATGILNANSASAVVVTIPTGIFPVNTILTIRQKGVGAASFAGTGVPTGQTYIVGDTYSIWQTATDVWEAINLPVEAVESGVTGIVKQELTADYTATINDLGKLFYNTGVTNYEFTIPDNATVDYSGNGAFRFVQFGTGKIQVNKAASVTAPTMESVTANIPFEYIETATDVWRVIGISGSYVAYTPSGGGGGNLYTEANAANADTDDNSIGNWTNNNNTAITVESTDVNDGLYALRIEQTGAGIYAEARDGSPAIFTIGNSYTLTFNAKVTGNTSDSVVYINGLSSTEQYLTNTWAAYSVTFTAVATAHQLRVALSNGVSNPNGTVVLLDNINIVEN